MEIRKERMHKWKCDEEFKAFEMGKMVEEFNSCDINENGYLNFDEMMAWGVMFRARDFQENGSWNDERVQTHESFFNMCNKITPMTDGVTMPDFMKMLGIWLVREEELEGAMSAEPIAM